MANWELQQADKLQARVNRYRPFQDQALLREIQKYYRVAIVYSSNALEGVSYTLTETKILIEDGLTAGGKPLKDALAVIGHAKAYDFMFTLLHHDGITEEEIGTLHSLFGQSLDNNAEAGAYRKVPAFITGSAYSLPPAQEVPARMAKLCENLQETASLHPLVRAALFHKDLAFIHPFADGNGRIARLAMNVLLIQQGYLPIVIPPLLRQEYVDCLEKAHVNSSDFVEFIIHREIDSQKELLRLLNDDSEEQDLPGANQGKRTCP